MSKSLNTILILFIPVLFISGLLFSHTAFASTLDSQLIDTGYHQASNQGTIYRFTGISGNLKSISLKLSSTYAGQYTTLQLYRCTTDTTYCGSGTVGMDTFFAPGGTSTTLYLTPTKTEYTFTSSSTDLLSSTTTYAIQPYRGVYGQDFRVYGSASDVKPSNRAMNNYNTFAGDLDDDYYVFMDVYGATSPPPSNGQTQVTSFSPADGTTTPSTTVTFTYQAYVASGDIGFWSGKQMIFYVQGQPVGWSQYFLDKVQATTTGYFNYSTTTVMAPGNYILNACIETSYLGGIVGGFDELNFWNNPCQYHQFVVGTSTFVGNLFQNGITSVQGQLNNITATSSTVTLGAYCNPFSGFDIVQCFYALLIPTSAQMQSTMNSFYSDFLTRMPWGYGSVAVADLLGYGTVATTSLASSNLTVVLPNTGVFATATSTSVLKGKSITFIDWGQMASSTAQTFWAPAITPLNNFINIMMGGAFLFWLYSFFKRMRP